MEKEIGKRIYQARISKDIKQEKLAELTNTSVSTISRLECGQTVPSLKTLLKISTALNVGLDFLLYDLFPADTKISDPDLQEIADALRPLSPKERHTALELIRVYTTFLK